MPIDVEKLPAKIQKMAYWRVNFRPGDYKTRIDKGPKVAFSLILASQIRLGGWPYPFVSDEIAEQIRAPEYIASGSEFFGHVEYWRLYYSGQFINLFAVQEKSKENWDQKLREQADHWMLTPEQVEVSDIPGFICITNLLYNITEIFEFLARLCAKGLYEGKLRVNLELHNIKGFALVAEYPRIFDLYCPATSERLQRSSDFESEQLLARSSEFALDWAIYFLGLFGWDNPPGEILRDDQQKFLSGGV